MNRRFNSVNASVSFIRVSSSQALIGKTMAGRRSGRWTDPVM